MRYLFILVLLISFRSFATDSTRLYNPSADVKKDMAAIVAKAKKEGKHVLIQVGGNWCVWCYRFHDFVAKDTALTRIENEAFVVYHLNYSKENKNIETLKTLGFPQRFGFPVFVVLDANGSRLHTQDSSLLEEGKGYNAEKVKSFFRPGRLRPWRKRGTKNKNAYSESWMHPSFRQGSSFFSALIRSLKK